MLLFPHSDLFVMNVYFLIYIHLNSSQGIRASGRAEWGLTVKVFYCSYNIANER